MQIAILFFLLACKIIGIYSGIRIEDPHPDIIHNGYCYGRWGDVGELAKGESRHVAGKCFVAHCKDDHRVIYRGCAPFRVPSHCVIVPGDESQPFPKCCRQAKCGEKPTAVLLMLENATDIVENDVD